MIPILLNHNHGDIIGKAEFKNNSIIMAFLDKVNITSDHIHNIGFGFIVHEDKLVDGVRILKKIEVFEISLNM